MAKTLIVEPKQVPIWSNMNIDASDSRIDVMSQVLTSSFFPFSYSGLSVFLDQDQYEPRAKIRNKEIFLSPHILQTGEFLKLFVHELGHFVDLYILRASPDQSDPSREFYRISWNSAHVKHAQMGMSAFVSGYAASNQYEDFAESFVWYIFHNEDFMDRALRHEALREKYLFFATYVFPHGEFQATDFSVELPPEYLWDTTKTPILLQKYLFFLRNFL